MYWPLASLVWKPQFILREFRLSSKVFKFEYSNALSFYRSQNVLGWSKFFEPDQKLIYKLWQSQTFCAGKIGFSAGTKVFEEALNAVKFLGWLKKFGWAQNVLGPVKGQGIGVALR